MIDHVFLPINVAIIEQIPICLNYPGDRLIWHYSSNGDLSVKSAYHFICSEQKVRSPNSSVHGMRSFWTTI